MSSELPFWRTGGKVLFERTNRKRKYSVTVRYLEAGQINAIQNYTLALNHGNIPTKQSEHRFGNNSFEVLLQSQKSVLAKL
jgi:hypothetical protein